MTAEEMAADSKRLPTAFLFSGRAQVYIARAAPGRPNIINGNLPLIKRVAATLKCEVSGPASSAKKDILGTFNESAVYKFTTADSGLPERHIENMVEPKRNQGAFQKPVDKIAAVSGHQHQFACIVDQNLDRRPDIEHKNTDADISDCADDRDKMCSAKK